jgi:hypothetical protein
LKPGEFPPRLRVSARGISEARKRVSGGSMAGLKLPVSMPEYVWNERGSFEDWAREITRWLASIVDPHSWRRCGSMGMIRMKI